MIKFLKGLILSIIFLIIVMIEAFLFTVFIINCPFGLLIIIIIAIFLAVYKLYKFTQNKN